MKIRSLKQALEQGYVICALYSKEGKRVRVTLREKHHEVDREMSLSFWIDTRYFKRTYPDAYERL